MSTAGGYFPDDKSGIGNDVGEYTSQYHQPRQLSPARIKYDQLSRQRCTSSLASQASHRIQVQAIRKASKYKLLNMPKELKQKSLKNLELLAMEEW